MLISLDLGSNIKMHLVGGGGGVGGAGEGEVKVVQA